MSTRLTAAVGICHVHVSIACNINLEATHTFPKLFHLLLIAETLILAQLMHAKNVITGNNLVCLNRLESSVVL